MSFSSFVLCTCPFTFLRVDIKFTVFHLHVLVNKILVTPRDRHRLRTPVFFHIIYPCNVLTEIPTFSLSRPPSLYDWYLLKIRFDYIKTKYGSFNSP